MAKTLKELAQEALSVQNACNLCGIAQSFARAMRELMSAVPDLSTAELNEHPIARAWADKIAQLTGTQTIGQPYVMHAFDECARLAKG